MQNQNSQAKLTTSWNPLEQEQIVKFLTITINAQKAFGKDFSIKDTYSFYRLKLDGNYPASLVLSAMDTYTDTHNDVPAPADLIAIMNPPKPKITTAEFIHAKQQWVLEGYPRFSYYAAVVKDYEQQEAKDRAKLSPFEEHLRLEKNKISSEFLELENQSDE